MVLALLSNLYASFKNNFFLPFFQIIIIIIKLILRQSQIIFVFKTFTIQVPMLNALVRIRNL